MLHAEEHIRRYGLSKQSKLATLLLLILAYFPNFYASFLDSFRFQVTLFSKPSTAIFPFLPLYPVSCQFERPYGLRILTSSATMASPASTVVVLPPMSLVLSPPSMATRTASSTILASWVRSKEYRNIMATERIVPIGF